MTDTKKPAWFKTQGVLGVTFKTKAAITEAVRTIINPRAPGDLITGPDQLFLLDVLSHHPEWAEKCGTGVVAVEVRMNTGKHFANKGVWLLRTNGTAVDISWRCAIDAAAPSTDRLVRDAARHAIADQVQDARGSNLELPCGICGLPIYADAHVDHAAPLTFEYLFASWHSGRGAIGLLDTGLHPVFANADDLADWQGYHLLFADLRRTHKHCNLSANNDR